MCQKCDNKELRKELEAVTLERDLLRKRIGEMAEEGEQLTEAREAITDLLRYFKSGNSVPVERATIKADCPEIKRLAALFGAGERGTSNVG